MNTKYTPSPWKVDKEIATVSGHPWAIRAKDTVLADICDSKNGAANARLIAAAPRLLEALHRLVNANESYAGSTEAARVKAEDIARAVTAARDAIAKATGSRED